MRTLLQRAALMLLSLMLLAGCYKKDDFRLAFSHNLHATENGMACSDCHGKMAEGRFATPGHAACTDCHADWITTTTIDTKTCGMCHKVKNLSKLSPEKPAQAAGKSGTVFFHSPALTNRCADCHGALMDKKLDHVPELTHKDKVRIREQAHRWDLECTACHVDMDKKTPPPNHRQDWTRRHGTMGAQEDNTCAVCHREESCRECHQVTMPASHNNLWRLKTHGVRAEWDRSRCLVCHQQDSCVACHAETRPLSHNAAWNQTHCSQCHTSNSTGTGCTLCHDTNLSSHPNPHAAGWRTQHCDSCHLGTPDAEKCGICHEGGASVENHPNPHAAGWRTQHCSSCHPGTPDAEKCGICHEGGANLKNHPNPHSGSWEDSHCFSCHEGSRAATECAICHAGGSSLLVHQNVWTPIHDRFGSSASSALCHECHEPGVPAGRLRKGITRKWLRRVF